MLIERHDRLGTETSARNSEVVHAGLDYRTGSMRARLCVAGKELLYRFCDENGVAATRCGKLLVATTEAELPKLHAIAEQAARNGVNDLVALSGEAAGSWSPLLVVSRPDLSPSTGVIDAAGLVAALDGHVTSLGGSVVLSTTATSLDRTADGLWRIGIESGGETASLTAKRVVNAAGHGATTLCRFYHRYRLPRAAHVSSERPLFLAQQPVAVPPADLPDAARRLARRTSHAGRCGPR